MSQSERDEEGLRAGYLAVEGQMFWHDDLRIVGDRTGLEVLKHAIDMALIHGKFPFGTTPPRAWPYRQAAFRHG